MSFDTVCSGCGAPSGPSVGTCPFCKTVFSQHTGQDKTAADSMVKLHNEGNVAEALSLGDEMLKMKPELKKEPVFLLTFVKVLIETEAPSSKIRSLLAEAYLNMPSNSDFADYLEIIEAKKNLDKVENSAGEIALKNILRRSPHNVHAHFFLGAHRFWVLQDINRAIPHLEICVRLHPNFLRGWGCLGAIYKQLGNTQLARRAFEKCAQLENNSRVKDFFIQQMKAA